MSIASNNNPVRIGRGKVLYGAAYKLKDGWVDPKDFLPGEFDICRLMFESGKENKGWWTGYAWDGLHVSRGDKIIKWKRCEVA